MMTIDLQALDQFEAWVRTALENQPVRLAAVLGFIATFRTLLNDRLLQACCASITGQRAADPTRILSSAAVAAKAKADADAIIAELPPTP